MLDKVEQVDLEVGDRTSRRPAVAAAAAATASVAAAVAAAAAATASVAAAVAAAVAATASVTAAGAAASPPPSLPPLALLGVSRRRGKSWSQN